mmetsp:Transcript_89301/g.251348  ORF Transcript_89301/g.251348 Transcript_89301/m.251348 type:complete len:511 (-) Transcript_89301:57-1589(-)
MFDPSCIVVDARHVEHPAAQRESALDDSEEVEWLRRPGQVRSCYEHLRRAFPRAQIDVFLPPPLWVPEEEDEHIAAVRRCDPQALLRVQKIPQGADLSRAMLLHALSTADGVIVSNDRFAEHVANGLASVPWVEKRVWGFLLGRGDLVLPQLSPVGEPQEACGVWRGTHERGDGQQHMSTALRERPDAKSPVVHAGGKVLKASPQEGLSVLQILTESCDSGELSTWVRVACTVGEGWLKAEHFKHVEGLAPSAMAALPGDAPIEVGQEIRHERADRPDFHSALRGAPGSRVPQLPDARVDAHEIVTVLGTQVVVDKAVASTWVNVSGASGVGWLKREHLRHVPPAKKRRRGEVWRCRAEGVRVASASSEDFVACLHRLLASYRLELRREAATQEVPLEHAEGDEADANRHWVVLEASVEGPRNAVAALRAGKLQFKVAGAAVHFADVGSKEDPVATRIGDEVAASKSAGLEMEKVAADQATAATATLLATGPDSADATIDGEKCSCDPYT